MKKYLVLCLLLMGVHVFAAVKSAPDNQCVIQQIETQQQSLIELEQKSAVKIPTGESHFLLKCELHQDRVFTFLKSELIEFEWRTADNEVKTPLQGTQPAYFLSRGSQFAELRFITHHGYIPYFQLLEVNTYIEQSQKTNLVMGSFYGLCLTLIFYVFILGRSLKDNTFRLYSAYISCASLFFLLQEGQLGLFLNAQSYWLSHQLYLMSAGLTVFSATLFIVRLTGLRTQWPKITNRLLFPSAWLVLGLSVLITLLEHNQLSALLGTVMAYLTLGIILVMVSLVAIQAYRRVPDALLVLVALSVLLLAMVFRVVLSDMSPTLNRYGLIIAFAFESFLLAVAVSERIKRLKKSKLLAEAEANYDLLCDVLSRRGWLKKAESLVEQQRHKGGMLGVLYIDLNKFKQVNDVYGHNVGDKVLQVVAKIIRHQIRDIDALGRIGGDEFVVLGHFSDKSIFHHLHQRVATRLQLIPIHTEEANITVSASVGAVDFMTIPKDISELLRDGDKAMYAEKLNFYHSINPI